VSDALHGRTALVTGASRGIGRSVVEALADAGARVWCLARTEADVRALAGEVGGEALTCDVTDDAATWDTLDGMMEAIGGAPDIVVNSAGVFGIAPIASETVAAFDRVLAVNLRGTFLVNRVVLPSMLGRGSGLIVNMGSVAGRKAYRGNASYSASKYGLRGYHEVLLEELRGTGVRATLLEPASTDTPIWDPIDPDNHPKLPNRRDMLRARDVAEAVLFLSTRPADVRIPFLQIERA
jgi:NAD(P)-dependent dehydrogenase (short-subunit alcohol dehydrogenase family)